MPSRPISASAGGTRFHTLAAVLAAAGLLLKGQAPVEPAGDVLGLLSSQSAEAFSRWQGLRLEVTADLSKAAPCALLSGDRMLRLRDGMEQYFSAEAAFLKAMDAEIRRAAERAADASNQMKESSRRNNQELSGLLDGLAKDADGRRLAEALQVQLQALQDQADAQQRESAAGPLESVARRQRSLAADRKLWQADYDRQFDAFDRTCGAGSRQSSPARPVPPPNATKPPSGPTGSRSLQPPAATPAAPRKPGPPAGTPGEK